MTLTPKNIFLFDAIGATVSTFLLGVVLTSLEDFFGMPKTVLFYLSLVAILFAIYSSSCFILAPYNWRPFLKTIAIANLLYCGGTLCLVIYFYQQLTVFGILYFIGELMAVAGLVRVELRIANLSTD